MQSKTIFVFVCWFLVEQITAAPLVIEIFRREPNTDQKRTFTIEINDNIVEALQRQDTKNDEPQTYDNVARELEQTEYDIAYNFGCSMPIPPNIVEYDYPKIGDDVITEHELARRHEYEQSPSIIRTTQLGLNSIALNAMSFGFALVNAVFPNI